MSSADRSADRRGVVLFAHGSREAMWKKPFLEMEKALSSSVDGMIVQAAFLKECEPSIDDVIGAMAASGVGKITVVPMFLAVGAHSLRDFPEIARRMKEKHADIDFEWTDVIGQWEETINALARVMADRLS